MNVFFTAAILGAIATASAADRIAPIAVAATSGTIVVLDSHGSILLGSLDDASGTLHAITRTYDRVSDMAAGNVNGELAIFLIRSLGDLTGRVTWYSGEGKMLKTWFQTGAGLTGIAFDSAAGVVYASGGRDLIYPIPVGGNKLGAAITVAGVSRIGPLAIDSVHHRLFAADVDYNSIFTVNLDTRATQRLASGLGVISALSYDAGVGALYVSDPGGKLYKISSSTGATPIRIPLATTLREPLGLAVISGGDLLIGDRLTHVVNRVTTSGKVVRQFR